MATLYVITLGSKRRSRMSENMPKSSSRRALFASADGCTVCDHIGLQAAQPHVREHAQCLVPPSALLASADGRVVRDHIQLQAAQPHVGEHAQGLVPPSAFLASAD